MPKRPAEYYRNYRLKKALENPDHRKEERKLVYENAKKSGKHEEFLEKAKERDKECKEKYGVGIRAMQIRKQKERKALDALAALRDSMLDEV